MEQGFVVTAVLKLSPPRNEWYPLTRGSGDCFSSEWILLFLFPVIAFCPLDLASGDWGQISNLLTCLLSPSVFCGSNILPIGLASPPSHPLPPTLSLSLSALNPHGIKNLLSGWVLYCLEPNLSTESPFHRSMNGRLFPEQHTAKWHSPPVSLFLRTLLLNVSAPNIIEAMHSYSSWEIVTLSLLHMVRQQWLAQDPSADKGQRWDSALVFWLYISIVFTAKSIFFQGKKNKPTVLTYLQKLNRVHYLMWTDGYDFLYSQNLFGQMFSWRQEV